MPEFSNNAFSEDTVAVRAERLQLIETNYAALAAEVGAPAAIGTWAADCWTEWQALTTDAGREANEAVGATVAYNAKIAAMRNEYQIARELAESIFEDREESFTAIGFGKPYPGGREKQLKHVEEVLDKLALVAGETPALPAALVTRLQTAATAARAAQEDQDKEASEETIAFKRVKELYRQDTRNLNAILKWWRASLGEEDPRIVMVGMLNPVPQSGGQPPAIPVATYAEPNMNWAAVANATSYDAETSADSGATTDDVLSAENVLTVVIPRSTTEIWARVRSRNANGVSNWGPWVIIPAIVALAPGNPTYIPPANGNAGKTICVVPPEAIAVRMFYQADGHPKSEIGLMTDGVYEWTLWLTPGTIFLQAEYPGGVVSAQVSLRVE